MDELKLDDNDGRVDIKSPKHDGWGMGVIIRFDSMSGQVQVLYQNGENPRYLTFWTHLDNKNEIARWKSKCKSFILAVVDRSRIQDVLNYGWML